ncbi:MAG: hypothetical protein V2A78_07370 [bacterium]
MNHETNKPIFFVSEGDAIIDDSALCSFLDGIEDTPSVDIVELISNMSRVIEAFVFFERVFVFSFKVDDENDEAYYVSKNPLMLASIIEDLSKEKILNFVSLLPSDFAPQPSRMLAQVRDIGIMPKESIAKFNNFNFGYYLYQQEVARRLNLPFISSDSKYARSFINSSNAFKYTLSQKLVQGMNAHVSKEFHQLLNSNHDIKFLVPPFLAVVLERVIKGASFGEAIMELRTQFQPVRKLFAQYNSEFRNPARSLKQQITYTSKIIKEIERVASSFSTLDRTTLTIWGDTFDFLIDSATDLANYSPIEGVSIIPRLSHLSKQALNLLILKRRYSSIYKLKKDFYNIKRYSTLLYDATKPFLEKARNLWPEGCICISPGNPFQDLNELEA